MVLHSDILRLHSLRNCRAMIRSRNRNKPRDSIVNPWSDNLLTVLPFPRRECALNPAAVSAGKHPSGPPFRGDLRRGLLLGRAGAACILYLRLARPSARRQAAKSTYLNEYKKGYQVLSPFAEGLPRPSKTFRPRSRSCDNASTLHWALNMVTLLNRRPTSLS